MKELTTDCQTHSSLIPHQIETDPLANLAEETTLLAARCPIEPVGLAVDVAGSLERTYLISSSDVPWWWAKAMEPSSKVYQKAGNEMLVL
jgi:hypothetical protein